MARLSWVDRMMGVFQRCSGVQSRETTWGPDWFSLTERKILDIRKFNKATLNSAEWTVEWMKRLYRVLRVIVRLLSITYTACQVGYICSELHCSSSGGDLAGHIRFHNYGGGVSWVRNIQRTACNHKFNFLNARSSHFEVHQSLLT